MSESATSREQRRQQTERRISVCAQRLTDEHGLDGFTMDDLATAADVSRRTLFNYFPSKLDAVLGNPPELPADDVETFLAGGPHGHLVEDLSVLAVALLSTKDLTRAELELGQRVFLSTPRLLVAAHERFEVLTGEFADLILAREGAEFGAARARLMVRLLVSIFDCCLPTDHHEEPDRPLADVFVDTLRTARDLLA